MMPEFPNAKQQIRESQIAFFKRACKILGGPFFGQISTRELHEGQSMRQEYSKNFILETEMNKIEWSMHLSLQELKENPLLVYDKWYECAHEFASQQSKIIVQGIEEVTKMTGNIVDSSQGFGTDQFFESLEKIEIEFDTSGNPILPTIVAGPETVNKMVEAFKQSENDPLINERMAQIIALKRKEFYDRETNRKLVD